MEHRAVSSHVFDTDRPAPLGAILAGGASRRFGAPKALAKLGGLPVVERIRRMLAIARTRPVLIMNEPGPFAGLGIDTRPDVIPNGGPLSGIHAALAWAGEEGRPGALCVACDMPFVPASLLAHILLVAASTRAEAVVPESAGRRGMEPLCAFYAASALRSVEEMLREGARRASDLASRLSVERISADEVRRFGDPAVMFLNVNTPDDFRRAEQIARERGEGA
jgi:molybdopterin-guanine dinucleotide biosynthesis protein A